MKTEADLGKKGRKKNDSKQGEIMRKTETELWAVNSDVLEDYR